MSRSRLCAFEQAANHTPRPEAKKHLPSRRSSFAGGRRFGICFIDDDGTRITLFDEAVGARRYTAPELEDGRADDVTPSADVYSLGKILYWLMAGHVFA